MEGSLTFYYGAMGSSKTADALMLRHQLLEKGYNVFLLKPASDTRDDEVDVDGKYISIIKSRIGLKAEAIVVQPNVDIRNLITEDFGVIIVDEAQFLNASQVIQLRILADSGFRVICYGLRTNFQSKLFDGSKRLFEVADSIKELHTTLCDCGAPAVVNARINESGEPIFDGEIIEVGAENKYKPMCYKCWLKSLKFNK